MKILYWLRNDLRIHDNEALSAFAKDAREGLIVWCPSRSQMRAKTFRQSFLMASLEAQVSRLKALGAKVCVFNEDIRQVFPELLRTHSFDAIYFSCEACSEEQEDEAFVKQLGVSVRAFAGNSLLASQDLPFGINKIPEVFTQFRKAVEINLKIKNPIAGPKALPGCSSLAESYSAIDFKQKTTHNHANIPAGELAGRERIQEYIWTKDRLRVYKTTRDGILEWNDSSKLSPYLSLGLISAREVYAEILKYEDERVRNESTYWLIFELLWRDYFYFIAQKWGSKLFLGMKSPIPTNRSDGAFERWKLGQTGQDFVDAHMREFLKTGWMSNRGRQNVANYLVKTLGGDWRKGAAYFEEHLIDYDAASNWGNWSYQAGVGQDPRNRVFDPERQAQMYDADGLYRRRWLDSGERG